MRIHQIAEIWPSMTEEDWTSFRADVGKNGLLQPIVTWQDAVVDGKHRERACAETGVEPRYDALDASWDEPRVLQHCASLHERRNLTQSQRACVGDLIRERYTAAAKARQGTRTDLRPTLPSAEGNVSRHQRTAAAQAAKAAGASEASVERAGFVRRNAPEAFEAVREGKLPLKVAERIAKAPEAQRGAMLAQLGTDTRTDDAGDSWGTPPEWIALARQVMGGIDVDPATNIHAQETVQAKIHYTAQDSGLEHEWVGRVWMNPPYSQPLIGQFIDKLIEEIRAKRCTQACVLVNNTTDTAAGQKMLAACSAALFVAGRVPFHLPGTSTPIAGTRQGQMLLYFGAHVDRFVSAASSVGWVGVSP